MSNVDPEKALIDLGIKYKVIGNNLVFRCLNPSHIDKNPSCSMNRQTGQFICPPCGFKGNLITLHKYLNRDYGYLLKDNYHYHVQNKKEEILSYHKEIDIEIVGKTYHPSNSDVVINYLKSIGVYDNSFIDKYGIEYCTYAEILPKHLKEIETPSRWSNRILIPVYLDGKKVNIEGRYFLPIEKVSKTKKILYPKGCTSDLLFNYENCNLNEPVIVVEGIKDLIKVWNVNKNVVSTFRNMLSHNQKKQLMNFTNDIIFFIDNDNGGWNGITKNSEECIDKEFKLCYNPINGRDPNDTNLKEIEYLVSNARYWSDIQIEKGFDLLNKEEIFW